MAADQFVIVPRPPVRAFALAAVLAVVGAALVVVPADGAPRIILVVLGIVLFVAAALLVGLAWAASRRQRVTIELDADGYRVDAPTGMRVGTWKDVTRVTTAPGRLTLHQGEAERVHLVAPNGRVPQLDEIAEAVSKRLDDDRGYTIWEG